MPRIPDDTADIAVYLYDSEAAAKAGNQAGGTGFLVMKPLERAVGRSATLLVTNKHVLLKGNRFVRITRSDGKEPEIIEIEDNQIFPHRGPHDVAIIVGIGSDQHKFRKHIAYDQLLASENAAKKIYDVGIGDDVVMIGRFIGHDGKEINKPSVRFGAISMDVASMYNTEAGHLEESYAVEMRSRPGFSGSAVLVYALHGSTKRQSQTKEFVMCLGVNWGHIVEPRRVLDENGKELDPPQFVKVQTDMAGVVPSWRIKQVIDYDDVKQALAAIEDNVLANKSGAG